MKDDPDRSVVCHDVSFIALVVNGHSGLQHEDPHRGQTTKQVTSGLKVKLFLQRRAPSVVTIINTAIYSLIKLLIT